MVCSGKPQNGFGGMKTPPVFLEARVHDLAAHLSGLCAGFENGSWRAEQLADHVFKWLPEFALTERELRELDPANLVDTIKKAASLIYKSGKFSNRGEFGELMLHICVRQLFSSLPAISKIYYKDGPNEVVKGFDLVHVVPTATGLELWLGESKFYDTVSKAVKDAAKSLEQHSDKNYMRSEFVAILNKIDPAWTHADALKKLLAPETSLDTIFERARFPVLVTYDSKAVGAHTKATQAFITEFETEVRKHHSSFMKVAPNIAFHLFILPLHKKKQLVAEFQKKLLAWQSI
jgi:hypothetical protein